MSSSSDGFESVRGGGCVWEPKQTGSKKAGNLQKLTADDSSWLIGHYVSSKEVTTKAGEKPTTIHKLKLVKVGNPDHLSEPDAEMVQVWGSGVLDKMIVENVQPGMLIKLQWLGIKLSQASGNNYHDWDVLVNTSVEPIDVNGIMAEEQNEVQSVEPTAKPPVKASADGDDDLPF